MTSDLNPGALEKLDTRQKQARLNARVNERTAAGESFGDAFTNACSDLPNTCAAINADRRANAGQEVATANDLSYVPQPSTDAADLLRGATSDEYSAAWKSNGNSFDPGADGAGAKRMHDSLIDTVQRTTRMPYVDANANVRTRFPALSALADSSQAAQTLQSALPPTSPATENRVNKNVSPAPAAAPPRAPRGPFQTTIPENKNPADYLRVSALANDKARESGPPNGVALANDSGPAAGTGLYSRYCAGKTEIVWA